MFLNIDRSSSVQQIFDKNVKKCRKNCAHFFESGLTGTGRVEILQVCQKVLNYEIM